MPRIDLQRKVRTKNTTEFKETIEMLSLDDPHGTLEIKETMMINPKTKRKQRYVMLVEDE